MIESTTLRQLCRLAIPIILSNVTIPLLGLTDALVLGHLPNHHAMAAVALADSLFSLLYMSLGFLRMGTTGLTAQAFGQKDYAQLRLILGQALLWASILAVFMLLSQQALLWLAECLLKPEASLQTMFRDYFAIRIWAAPATLANAVVMGWLLGVQRPRALLLIVAVINFVAIGLDVVLVYDYGLSAPGIALAITAGQWLGLVAGFICVRGVLARYRGQWQWRDLFNWRQAKRMTSVNGDLFVRSVCLMLTFAFMTRQGSLMGSLTLAVNNIILMLVHLLAYTLDGFVMATETVIGEAVGLSQKQRIMTIVKNASLVCLLLGIIFAALYGGLHTLLFHAITDIPALRVALLDYVPWLVVLPLISVWAYLFDGVFIGLTQTRAMRHTMLLCVAGFLLIWWLTERWGNHGLWFAFACFLAGRGLSLWIVFYYDHLALGSRLRYADP